MKLSLIFLVHLQSAFAVVLPPPSIEPCPHDSLPIDGVCKCAPELCQKPSCLWTLSVVTNGTDTPNECCPTYACVDCPDDVASEDGRCPCAPGALIDPMHGTCHCVDPTHRLDPEAGCICDPDLCPMPDICDDDHVKTFHMEGCCKQTKCIKCPEDSYPNKYNSDQIEDKCVCFPCKEHKCASNQTVHIRRHGNYFPGTCCDLYDCINGSTCLYEDVVHSEGESWETSDKQICKCQTGIALCSKDSTEESLRSCHHESNVYRHNESWMADSCTNCTCIDGEEKCIAHWCDVHKSKVKKTDCQPVTNCKRICPYGFKMNRWGCELCKCNSAKDANEKLLVEANVTLDKVLDEWKTINEVLATNNITIDELDYILKYGNEVDALLGKYNVTLQELEKILKLEKIYVNLNPVPTTQKSYTPVVSDKEVSTIFFWSFLFVVAILVLAAVAFVAYKIVYPKIRQAHKYETVKLQQNNNIVNDKSTIKLYNKR